MVIASVVYQGKGTKRVFGINRPKAHGARRGWFARTLPTHTDYTPLYKTW